MIGFDGLVICGWVAIEEDKTLSHASTTAVYAANDVAQQGIKGCWRHWSLLYDYRTASETSMTNSKYHVVALKDQLEMNQREKGIGNV